MAFTPFMSLKDDGSMRFRCNESNENRTVFFERQGIGQPVFNDSGFAHISTVYDKTLVSLELIHSHIVYDVSCNENGEICIYDDEGNSRQLKGLQGDGYITRDIRLVPCVTVADCMPLWLYDEESGVFGVVHSGWKGTGIIVEALKLAEKRYGTRRESVRIIMGPHIHDCCYNVDPERVSFFSEKFGSDCISFRDGTPFLSLQQANLNALNDFGVPLNHITISNQCTCCSKGFLRNNEQHSLSKGPDTYLYGSFRRQTADLPLNMPFEEKSRCFTVMAAAAVMN